MKQNGILAGLYLNDTRILVCATEVNTEEEIKRYIDLA